MADLKKLAEEIVNLTLLEAQELKTILKDEYGIEPAAGGAVMMAGPAGGEAAVPAGAHGAVERAAQPHALLPRVRRPPQDPARLHRLARRPRTLQRQVDHRAVVEPRDRPRVGQLGAAGEGRLAD